MHFIGLSIALQLACAIHCARHGRNRMWMMIILFLSIPGCLAYLLFEAAPQLFQRREVRLAKGMAIRKLDPEREVRAAREALDTVDTAANRTRLGDALADNGEWKKAIPEYERALAKTPGGDRAASVKLARAYLESGNPAQARKILSALPSSLSGGENDRARLLLARSLDELGSAAEALALYEELGQRLPGGEAQCRRATLLLRQNRNAEARAALEEVERLVKRVDLYERAENADMYGWAARTLAELREAPGRV